MSLNLPSILLTTTWCRIVVPRKFNRDQSGSNGTKFFICMASKGVENPSCNRSVRTNNNEVADSLVFIISHSNVKVGDGLSLKKLLSNCFKKLDEASDDSGLYNSVAQVLVFATTLWGLGKGA